MKIQHFLLQNMSGEAYVYRCDECAAVVLSQDDLKAHQKWHDGPTHCDISGVELGKPCLCCDHPSKNDDKPFVQELGNWDTV